MQNQAKKLSNDIIQHKLTAHSFNIECLIVFYVNIWNNYTVGFRSNFKCVSESTLKFISEWKI